MAGTGTKLLIGSALLLFALIMSCEEIRVAFFRKPTSVSQNPLVISYNASWILGPDLFLYCLLTTFVLAAGRARTNPFPVILFIGVLGYLLCHAVECRTARLIVNSGWIRFESVWRTKQVAMDAIGSVQLMPSHGDSPDEPYIVGKDGRKLISLVRFLGNPVLAEVFSRHGIRIQVPLARFSHDGIFKKCLLLVPALAGVWLLALATLFRTLGM